MVESRGCSLLVVHKLPVAVASLVAGHGLEGTWIRGHVVEAPGSRAQA